MLQRQRSTLIRSFIFLTSFRMVTSGLAKYVHRGEPIQLISYSDICNCTEVFLYINGVKNLTLIGLWKLETCTTEEVDINPEYQGKIYMDRYRNIWILKVDGSDAAKYHISCDNQNSILEVELNLSSELTEQDQIHKCQLDAMCMKNCLGIINSTAMPTTQKEVTKETSHHTTIVLTEGTSFSNPMIIAILVIVVFIFVTVIMVLFWQCGYCQFKKKTVPVKETQPLLESFQQQREHVVSDVDRPNFSLLWSFQGKTQNNKNEAWLLDVVLNPDHDLIVTDGQNFELKKFSLQGELKSKLSFKSRPHCLALTDGHCVTVTFPFQSVLLVIDTRGEMSVASTIPFRSQCAGIGSMKDGRIIISNRESRSVIVCSKDGNELKELQEIKNDSSEETLFSKPAYVRVVDNTTFYVSDDRTQEVFVIRLEAGNTFTVKKQQKVTDPRTSCVMYDMLLVAASNIRLFTLDGKEAGEVILDGVQHVRGLAFSEDKQLLAITHRSEQGEKISVYHIRKH